MMRNTRHKHGHECYVIVKVGLPLSREINNSMKRQGDGRYWAANPYDLLPLCGAVIPLK